MTRLTGVAYFDGTSWHEHATVDADGPDDAIDLTGHSVLPGFIDAHVHLGLVDPSRVLAHGVTTVRDLGAPLGAVPEHGPRVLVAGQMLTAPGGYPSRAAWAPKGTAREVLDIDDAHAAVDEQRRAGACVIKVALDDGPVLDPQTLRAIVLAAEPLAVTAHVASVALLERALTAGVRELAHGLWSDETIPPSLVAELVAREVTIVPTLHIDSSPVRIENLRACVEAGARVVYGTDMGNPPAAHGIDVNELRLMQRAGMTLDDTLASATSRAADYLEIDLPDVIVVPGDPRADLDVLAHPVRVMRA